MKIKPSVRIVSRRQFLGGTAIGALDITVLPKHVLGLGTKSPNEKLNIAGIGIGGQGGSDINNMPSENIVVLCDVDWRHASGLFKKFPKARQFKDYRKMLDEIHAEVDGVVVATPD